MSPRHCLVLIAIAGGAGSWTTAHAQVNPLPRTSVQYSLDSGLVNNEGKLRDVIFAAMVTVPDAPWLRLKFSEAMLGATPPGGQSTQLRITSMLDGGQQHMYAAHLAQWQNSTAYFNGDSVWIEIIADPGAPPSQIAVNEVEIGVWEPNEGGVATICGATDDRILSDDPRAARALPVGCTAWLFNDYNHTFLTAGHCVSSGLEIIEFNVPLSSANGTLQHPGPEDQYAVDPASVQFNASGLGNDWCYFGCFPNSTTGLTPYQAQQDFYHLAQTPPAVDGQLIRITGYGVDSTPQQNNQVQQTHAGPYTSFSGTQVQYQTDTTGGNSGSAVFDETSQFAIGIHTNGGCGFSGGSNIGCGINNTGLQNALDNPQGVCIPVPTLEFFYPDGLPSTLNPNGDSVRVHVLPASDGVPVSGTGVLYYSTGAEFVDVAMIEVEPNIYDAVFPPIACETDVAFYLSAQNTLGETIYNPQFAPRFQYGAFVSLGLEQVVIDDFETDTGWTVSNSGTLTTGMWERGTPIGNGDRRDPPTDADGSGQCYVTQNVDGNFDVDEGSTTLTSPPLDTDAPNPYLGYWRWFSSSAATFSDTMLVQVSDDGGLTWIDLETVDHTVGDLWVYRQFPLDEIAGLSGGQPLIVRFTASDIASPTVVEAGVDGVRIESVVCMPAKPCPADLADADGSVGSADLAALLASWGQCAECAADLAPPDDPDGIVGPDDLAVILAEWGACP
jgi:V8-like Glu-specific endopeptidase